MDTWTCRDCGKVIEYSSLHYCPKGPEKSAPMSDRRAELLAMFLPQMPKMVFDDTGSPVAASAKQALYVINACIDAVLESETKSAG